MNLEKCGWDETKLNLLFDEDTVQAIRNIPRWTTDQEDRWVWLKTPSREFSVKSAFREIAGPSSSEQDCRVKALIWKSKLHNRLKKYLWPIVSNLLPTYTSLVRFNPNLDTCCCLCEQAPKTSLHLFWDCALARALWFGSEWNIKTDIFPLASLVDLIELLLSLPLDWGLDSSVMGRFLMVEAVIVDQI